MRLDLGSLGKGFVAQKALNYLKSKGVVYAMIDAGGKIVTLSPKNQSWTIGINQIREKNKEVPIIFLTAKSMKEDVLKGYKVGADDYLNKPFDSEVFPILTT